MPELRVEALTHVYSAGTPFEKTAIENISLTIPQGQMVGVLGHTGSGKSTFIQHLNALLRPSSGAVYYDGKDVNATKHSRREVKAQVGLVFQYPEYQLFEETVFRDIAFGPKNQGLDGSALEARVREAAAFVGVDETLFERSPLELSGGQKRRVAIAGVIAMRPGVLVLDEPTAGLDPAGCRQILDNIQSYREKTGSTVILVSHNMDDAARMAERLIVFDHGRVAMDGTPEEVFSRPEELIAIGLNVPHAAAIAMALRQRGVRLEGSIYTHEQLKAAIRGAKEAGVC